MGKKILVMPDSRRNDSDSYNGTSKKEVVKGLRKKINSFSQSTVSVKRSQNFSLNVENNEPVAEKSDISMSSRTKLRIRALQKSQSIQSIKSTK